MFGSKGKQHADEYRLVQEQRRKCLEFQAIVAFMEANPRFGPINKVQLHDCLECIRKNTAKQALSEAEQYLIHYR